jgi:hypothetical protein
MGLGAIPGADEGARRIEQGFDLPAPQAALGYQGVGNPLGSRHNDAGRCVGVVISGNSR